MLLDVVRAPAALVAGRPAGPLVAALAMALTAAGCGSTVPATEVRDGQPAAGAVDASTGVEPPSTAPVGSWASILRGLDRQRDLAFRRSDPGLLRAVYVPGSAVLSADIALLREYARRGLRLDSARLRLWSLDVVDSARTVARLRVVDALDPVRVRAVDAAWHRLPRDGPTERIITLREQGQGEWRIAGVRRLAG